MTSIANGAGLSAAVLILGIIIFVCVLLNSASTRRGLPMLLAFIVFGIVCGNVGHIPIYLDDRSYASDVCTIALIFIMFYGGFGTRWKSARSVAPESALLASLGVFATAFLTGLFCHFALKWNWIESFLLGSVVSSTDAASVFSILRNNRLSLKNNTASILEVESGSNDPAAFMLTAVMISVINGNTDAGHIVWMIFAQIIIGTICGLFIAQAGLFLMRRIPFTTSGFDSLMVFAIAIVSYSLPDILGGNGYLSAYIVGIIMGNNSFHGRRKLVGFFDGINGLMQMIIFFILGLLARPQALWNAFPPAIVITAVLLLLARSIAVGAILTPFRKYPLKQQLLINFAGLRGASSIVFAIIASAGCPGIDNDIFSIVFCIVLISIGIEGTLIPKVSRKLDMIDTSNDVMKSFSDFEDETTIQFGKLTIERGSKWDGVQLKETKLPKGLLVCRVVKPSGTDPEKKIRIIPDGNTTINAGDIVIFCSQSYSSDKELHIIEKEVNDGSKWQGRSISDYNAGNSEQILMILRDQESIIPDGGTLIHSGDILFVNAEL
ncbi:MAG: potassium/proton antiporter [Bacteroidales bacterium]|nr:potassium/proton antiporter [Candidatus Egerieousia equi]